MGRSRSRSLSPIRRKRAKERDNSKKRKHRNRSKSREKRSVRRRRSRTKSRSKSRSYERQQHPTSSSSSSKSKPQQIINVSQADLEGKTAEEVEMMKVMGFCGFETTKNKKVEGNDPGAVHVILKRKYRQYMNRKGGFNRPLDFVA